MEALPEAQPQFVEADLNTLKGLSEIAASTTLGLTEEPHVYPRIMQANLGGNGGSGEGDGSGNDDIGGSGNGGN